MAKSMVNSCLLEFLDFTRVFSLVKVLCNGPKVGNSYDHIHEKESYCIFYLQIKLM